MTTATAETVSEFTAPPSEPDELLQAWLADAHDRGVAAPLVSSMATANGAGGVSNRIVRALDLTADGMVFTSHTSSRKGRDLAVNPRASAVLYWQDLKRQVIVSGRVVALTAAESDELWSARPARVNAMSAVAVQSERLDDETALREAAARIAGTGEQPPRPARWKGHRLVPDEIEFWLAGEGGLHRRLRYTRGDGGWHAERLQP